MHFGVDIVTLIDDGQLDVMAGVAQKRGGDIGQGVVQFAIGVTKFFTGVD
ncbi:hypothetical protein GGER_45730 [Serratia rubidaea]